MADLIPSEYRKPVWDLIETAGHATQSIGIGRVIGQIYACLYLSSDAATLDDLVQTLRISKGSASMAVRRLADWGAVEKTVLDGDRKDYYRASERFGRIVRNAARDVVAGRIEAASRLLREVESRIDEGEVDGGKAFMKRRVETIKHFEERMRSVWDNVFVGLLLR